MDADYAKDYEEFWKELLEVDGKLDKDKVMRELHDYRFLMEQASLVYCHVSGGMISKTNTYAFEVNGQNDRVTQEYIEEAVAEERERCAEIAESHDVMRKGTEDSYFKGWARGGREIAQEIRESQNPNKEKT